MESPPAPSPADTRRRLTRRYVRALVALAVVVTAAEVVVQLTLTGLVGDIAEVDLAGRQRMLSQRIALAAVDGDVAAAERDVREWAAVHRALLDGDPDRGVRAVDAGEARSALAALTPDVDRVRGAVAALASARAAGDAAAAARAARGVVEGARAYLPGMERVVSALDAESAAAVRRLRLVVLAVWLAILLLAVALARFVFRPSVEGVAAAVGRVVTQQRLLQTVVDTIPDHIYVKDREGRALLRNRASARALGVADPAGTLGKTDAELAGDAEDLGAAALADDLAVVRTGVPVVDKEEPDGAGGWLLTTKVPFEDASGEVVGVVGVSRDVTERVEVQRALERAKEAAEAGALAKETFLANVSHEMRTPLHAVLGLSRLLAAGPVSPSQTDLVTGITRAADTLLALIDDLLDRARLDAGGVVFHERPFFLADVLDDVGRLLRPLAEARGLEVRVDGPDGVDTLLGDAKRLRQVLLNLGGNAVKFTNAGWVAVSAAVEGRADGEVHLRFDVEDTGAGIPADRQADVFDPFVQADGDATREHGGTGLGLSIVRDLVERQGGRVALESVEGAGSRFTVRLPFRLAAVDAPAPAVAPPADAAAPDLTGARVLIVEDNPTNRLIARRQVEAWGMVASEAASGQEALDALAAGAPVDLVLMDLQMPGMDGIETTRRIRAAGFADLPVVALTASALASRRGATLGAGFSDFVTKPFEPAALRRRLALLLGRLAPAPADTAAIDRARLRESAVGDPALERHLAGAFQGEVTRGAPALLEAAAEQDGARLRAEAHSLKGQAAYVGARAAVEALGRLEGLSRSAGAPALVEATAEATAALADAAWALRVLFPPQPVAP